MIEKMMKDSVKSSVVSTKPLPNFRQDYPSRVVVKSKLPSSNVAKPKNCLSWYVELKSKPSEDENSHMPRIKWNCPPKFAINASWHVAAGGGSQETMTQKLRETTVLEVVYPDLTSIPPSPFDSAPTNECFDKTPTPIITMIPIEEVAAGTLSDTSTSEKVESVPENLPVSQSNPSRSQDQVALDKSLSNMLRGIEKTDLEVAVAAAATVAAVMEKKEQIDTELLIKFLTDPNMLKKLLDANKPTSKPENKTPPAPDTKSSLPLPSPKSVHSELVKTSIPLPSPKSVHSEPVETSIPLPTPKPVHRKPVKTSIPLPTKKTVHRKPVKKSIPLPSPSPCLPPIGNLPVMRHVRPLIPYSSTTNEEIDSLVNKYLALDAARIMPMGPLNPSTSIPNKEAVKKMIHHYGAEETMNGYRIGRGCGNTFVGPRPLPSLTPLPHVTNHAMRFNFFAPGNIHFSPVTPPAPNVGLNYYKPLIEQHGVMHEMVKQRSPVIGQPGNYLQGFREGHNNLSSTVMNPKKRPCVYFSSSPNGCPDGYNWQYLHDGLGRRGSGAMEFPGSKRMKFTEQMGNWR